MNGLTEVEGVSSETVVDKENNEATGGTFTNIIVFSGTFVRPTSKHEVTGDTQRKACPISG